MARIKEPAIGTTELPKYKSPTSRILRSLRKGYDNSRQKIAAKSDRIMDLRGALRDTQESRDSWKQRAKKAEIENIHLHKEKENLEVMLKKRDERA